MKKYRLTRKFIVWTTVLTMLLSLFAGVGVALAGTDGGEPSAEQAGAVETEGSPEAAEGVPATEQPEQPVEDEQEPIEEEPEQPVEDEQEQPVEQPEEPEEPDVEEAERREEEPAKEPPVKSITQAVAEAMEENAVAEEAQAQPLAAIPGTNLTWKLDNGTLTIGGTGDMPDFSDTSEQPWFLQAGTITAVVIEDGVTSVGQRAFVAATSLASVTIPDSVSKIGSRAFNNCNSLSSVAIPDSVTSIGSAAFAGCSSLTSITIPKNVTNIGSNAFQSCTSLNSIEFRGAPPTIGAGVFLLTAAAGTVRVPNGMEEVYKTDLTVAGLTFSDTAWKITSGRMVTLAVQKDGSPFDAHGRTFVLQQNQTDRYTGTGTDGTVIFPDVEIGNYILVSYKGGAFEGRIIGVAVDEDDATATADFYTIKFAVKDEGAAKGSTVSATNGDISIQSGDAVIEGNGVSIVAVGKGAQTYTYKWSGEGVAANQTAAEYIDVAIREPIDALCTVTGAAVAPSPSPDPSDAPPTAEPTDPATPTDAPSAQPSDAPSAQPSSSAAAATAKTGDDTNFGLYIVLLLIACAGVTAGVLYRRRAGQK